MTHYLETYSGKIYFIDQQQSLMAAEKRNQDKSVRFRQYPDDHIMPGDIKHIGPKKDTSYGPHAPVSDRFMKSLPTGKNTGFWQEVLNNNFVRGTYGKEWLPNQLILEAHQAYPQMSAGDLMALIEWRK